MEISSLSSNIRGSFCLHPALYTWRRWGDPSLSPPVQHPPPHQTHHTHTTFVRVFLGGRWPRSSAHCQPAQDADTPCFHLALFTWRRFPWGDPLPFSSSSSSAALLAAGARGLPHHTPRGEQPRAAPAVTAAQR